MSDDLDNWRNSIAKTLCNAILNTVATKTYRDFIGGAIRLGMAAAVKNTPAPDRSPKGSR